MTTRQKLLSFFEEHRGSYYSGEALAEQLSLSRTAVWKAVNKLREEGYPIDALPKKGYCLSAVTDILSEPGIRKYLDPSCQNLTLTVFPTIGSTNSYVKALAGKGAPEGTVVLANNQTGGRGRIGRSFYSPADTGVYLSILLRPKQYSLVQAARITTIAAAAACRAILSLDPALHVGIKWVNDIFVGSRKVSGILTEAALDMESGCVDYAVMGIGLNVYTPADGFPGELQDIAGSIFDREIIDGKNRLCSAFLNTFMQYYLAESPASYVEDYRKLSIVIGRKINVLKPDAVLPATALSIDDDCHLKVRYENGTEETLSSGEISIRLSDQ